MKRVQYHLTEAQLARLRAMAKATGLSVAELIRRFVDAGLEGADRKAERRGD